MFLIRLIAYALIYFITVYFAQMCLETAEKKDYIWILFGVWMVAYLYGSFEDAIWGVIH